MNLAPVCLCAGAFLGLTYERLGMEPIAWQPVWSQSVGACMEAAMGSKEKPPGGCRDHDAYEREMAWAKGLKAGYDRVAEEPLPDRFQERLKRLEDVEQ